MNKLLKSKTKKIKNKKKGFTLVELIIVMAVIALLASMTLPKLGSTRLDAKINNDVVAAKNIATQIAMAIANGELAEGKGDLNDEELKVYTDRLDGTIGTPALDGKKFLAKVEKGNVTILVDTHQLYPVDETKKVDYVKAVKAQ